jgi:hypothetical protein
MTGEICPLGLQFLEALSFFPLNPQCYQR